MSTVHHTTRYNNGPAAAPPDPVDMLAPAPADALPAIRPPQARLDIIQAPADVEFQQQSPYVIEVSENRVSWTGIINVCSYIAQWIVLVSLTGAAIVAGYYIVFHLVPALLEGIVQLVSAAIGALVAGVKSALFLIGQIAAAIMGALLLVMLARSTWRSDESVSDEPAPGQPARTANNTRSAVNNSAKTTVVTVINNLNVEQ